MNYLVSTANCKHQLWTCHINMSWICIPCLLVPWSLLGPLTITSFLCFLTPLRMSLLHLPTLAKTSSHHLPTPLRMSLLHFLALANTSLLNFPSPLRMSLLHLPILVKTSSCSLMTHSNKDVVPPTPARTLVLPPYLYAFTRISTWTPNDNSWITYNQAHAEHTYLSPC